MDWVISKVTTAMKTVAASIQRVIGLRASKGAAHPLPRICIHLFKRDPDFK